MKKHISIPFLFLLLAGISSCGENEMSNSFSVIIGNSYSRDLIITTEGGYAIAGVGSSNDSPTADLWTTKVDRDGNIEWETIIVEESTAEAYALEQTMDGGYILTGEVWGSSGGHGDNDFWVVKIDAFGELDWQRAMGGSDWEIATSIRETSDDGFIVVGESQSNDFDVANNYGGRDCWVVKLDDMGNISWQKNFGGSGYEEAQDVQITNDGGYIIAAYSASSDGDVTFNNGQEDFWIIKLNESGNLMWQKSYGGSQLDWASTIQQTEDGGYIVAGNSSSADGDVGENKGTGDVWTLKLDASGNIEWKYSMGWSNWDGIKSVRQTLDGGYIMAGNSYMPLSESTDHRGESDILIIKLDAQGNLEWHQLFGGSGVDEAHSVLQLSTGDFIIGANISNGNGSGGSWIFKLDASGHPIP